MRRVFLTLVLLLAQTPLAARADFQAPVLRPLVKLATQHAAVIDSGGTLRYALLDGTGSLPAGRVLALSANPKAHALELPPFASSDDPRSQEQWALRFVGAKSAWGFAKGSAVVVAIVDTGVSPHADLPNVLPGKSFTSDASTADPNGHGTHVAGIVAAAVDNKIGVAGLAPSASILPVRVLGPDGSGDHVDIAAGITWAADQGADIINLSLGGEESSEVLASAVSYATAKGAIVVAAAGNSGFGSNAPVYPAAYDESIAVAAVGPDGSATAFSNTGTYVDIAAPGFAILSTAPSDNYEYLSGTSQAAPYVSAALALLLSTGLSRDAAVSRLYSSAKDAAPAGKDLATGNGVLDAAAALGAPPTSSPQLPTPLPDLPAPSLPELRPPTTLPNVLPGRPMVSLMVPPAVQYGSSFEIRVLASGCSPCRLTLRTPTGRSRTIEVLTDLAPVVVSERARSAGSVKVYSEGGEELASARIAVDPVVTVSAKRRGSYSYVSGFVRPSAPRITLQYLKSGRWVDVYATSAHSGSFQFKLPNLRRGLYRVSVSAPSDPFFL